MTGGGFPGNQNPTALQAGPRAPDFSKSLVTSLAQMCQTNPLVNPAFVV